MIYDVCVIGAGVNGSAAAYSLSKKKKNVLLLEQFPVPHTRGSSHGQSRIIRCLCSDKIYGVMTCESYPIWKEIEKEIGEELMIRKGILEVYDGSTAEKVKRNISVLDSLDVRYDMLTSCEINTRYPPFDVPQNCSGIYEYEGGMLAASKCVAGLQKVFVKNGGEFKDSETVIRILPEDIVTIQTSKGEYKAKSVIITAGPFTSKLVSSLGLNLPLSIERAFLTFWKLDELATCSFPSFIGPFGVYGFRPLEYPGYINLCEWSRTLVNREKLGPDSDVSKFINRYMKGAEHTQTVIEETWFTMTPDYHFILDIHPEYRNVVIGAGFSGSGFKMAPVTGNILADLALGNNPSYDLSMFRIDRFK